MSHIRSPMLQTCFNKFSLTFTPTPIIHLCVSEDPSSPRQSSEKKDRSPKAPRKYAVYRYQHRNNYHSILNHHVARNINTLTNLNSSDGDFEKNPDIVVQFLLFSMFYNSLNNRSQNFNR